MTTEDTLTKLADRIAMTYPWAQVQDKDSAIRYKTQAAFILHVLKELKLINVQEGD